MKSNVPQYTPPTAPPPAQADPAFAELKAQTDRDREDAIRAQVTRDSAAQMMRYGQRYVLAGRAPAANTGLSPAPPAPTGPDNPLAAVIKAIGGTQRGFMRLTAV